jgi:hypothetical protein
MDRIMHDDVFRLNMILNGGWTKDTFHILEELIELALSRNNGTGDSVTCRTLTGEIITNEERRDLRTKDAAPTSSKCDKNIVYTPLEKKTHYPQVWMANS